MFQGIKKLLAGVESDRLMKLWIIASEYPGERTGGIARYVENIAAALTERGVDLTVITQAQQDYSRRVNERFSIVGFAPHHNQSAAENSRASSLQLKAFPSNILSGWPALSYQVADVVEGLIQRMGAPDIIECQEYGALPYYLLQRKLLGNPLLQNIPILVHCHQPSFLTAEFNHQPAMVFPDYWVGEMEKFSIAAADAVLCPSNYLAKQITELVPCRGEIQVIPLPSPALASLEFSTISPFSSDKPTVLYFGRFEISKGILKALESIESLWNAGRNFRVVLIGEDTEYKSRGTTVGTFIRSRYAHRIQTELLEIRGACPFDELQKHIVATQIIIVPSLWDNFPNTCIEAMFFGRVVLASKSGGQAEMIGEDGQAGVLFDWEVPEDFKTQLDRLFKISLEKREQMGKIACARITEYCSLEKTVSQRLRHFEEIIEQHRRPTFFPAAWSNYTPPNAAYCENSHHQCNQTHRLSVVIPFFNLGKYIQDAVQSALRSTLPAEEILIVNDGSTEEDDLAILRRLENEYPSVRVIHQPNRGLASARNTGAREARGEAIAFLDADDEVLPEFFEKALRVLDAYANVGFVYSWVQCFGNSGGIWPTWNTHFPYLLGHNMLIANCVVRKEAFLNVGGNNSKFEYSLEDYECWIHLMKHGWLGVSLPECLVRYRIRTGSMMRSANDDQFCYLYDQLVRTHPELYQQWGGELMRLQASNGSALQWDHPARSYSQPTENYLRSVEKQRDAFREETQILDKALKQYVEYIQKQRQKIKRLRRCIIKNDLEGNMPDAVNGNDKPHEDGYEELLKEQRDLLEGRLAVANEILAARSTRAWEYEIGARIVRRLRSIRVVRFLLRQPLLLRTLNKIF